jgi:hypothetical protein
MQKSSIMLFQTHNLVSRKVLLVRLDRNLLCNNATGLVALDPNQLSKKEAVIRTKRT